MEPISVLSRGITKLFLILQDLEGYQALPVQLDVLVPRALPDQVVKEEEREPQVLLDPRENEAVKDCEDPPEHQARLVNQHNVNQILVMDVS